VSFDFFFKIVRCWPVLFVFNFVDFGLWVPHELEFVLRVRRDILM
jgi:hypothetical protein